MTVTDYIPLNRIGIHQSTPFVNRQMGKHMGRRPTNMFKKSG